MSNENCNAPHPSVAGVICTEGTEERVIQEYSVSDPEETPVFEHVHKGRGNDGTVYRWQDVD